MPLPLRRLPLLKGKTFVYPSRPVCPVCGENRVFEPHSFATLSFGAMLNTRGGAGGDDRMDGFLNLVWHDAHSDVADRNVVYASVPVADDVQGGQGELYFCSTPCLRRFFKGLVDELDRRVQVERHRRKPRGARRPAKQARSPVR